MKDGRKKEIKKKMNKNKLITTKNSLYRKENWKKLKINGNQKEELAETNSIL
jgi:hypothetical protein